MAANASGQLTTVVLMSKTGSGKSSLANALLGTNDFAIGKGMRSETSQCQGQMKFVRGRNLLAVDTPGTMDVKDPSMPLAELLKALNNCPTGVDAFLVVIRGNARFTNEECKAIQESVDVFGPESCKRAIVVFSNGDHYDNDEEEFKKELQKSRSDIPGLNELMNKFGNRFVLMDNGKSCDEEFKEKQVTVLLNMIDEVGKLNPQKYSQKDLDSQTEIKLREKELEEFKKQQKKQEKQQKEQERLQAIEKEAKMRAELDALKMQFDVAQRSAFDLTDVLTTFGRSVGAVIASPVVGAGLLIEKALNG